MLHNNKIGYRIKKQSLIIYWSQDSLYTKASKGLIKIIKLPFPIHILKKVQYFENIKYVEKILYTGKSKLIIFIWPLHTSVLTRVYTKTL